MKTATKFERLKGLGGERLEQIDFMLLAGRISAPQIARRIRDEWYCCRDISAKSLTRQLNRYRAEIVEPRELGKQLATSRSGRRSAAIKAGETYDSLGALTKLVKAGEKRLSRYLEREEKMPIPMGAVKDELKVLGDLIDKLARLQLEVGILKRAPKQLQALVGVADAGHLLDFEAEINESAKVRGAIEGILEVLRSTDNDTEELLMLEAPNRALPYTEVVVEEEPSEESSHESS